MPFKTPNSKLIHKHKLTGQTIKVWHTPDIPKVATRGGTYYAEVRLDDDTLYHQTSERDYWDTLKDAYEAAEHYQKSQYDQPNPTPMQIYKKLSTIQFTMEDTDGCRIQATVWQPHYTNSWKATIKTIKPDNLNRIPKYLTRDHGDNELPFNGTVRSSRHDSIEDLNKWHTKYGHIYHKTNQQFPIDPLPKTS